MASVTHKDKSSTESFGANVGQAAKDAGNAVGNESKQMGQKVGDMAKKAGDETKKFGEKIGDEAKSMASAAMQKTEDAASYVGHKADDATEAVGHSMKSLGGTIRENTPREGMLANAGGAVASTLESGGKYLEDHNLKDISEDLTGVIRRNPVPAVLLALGIGFLLARATRS